jgi:hypothetical protein
VTTGNLNLGTWDLQPTLFERHKRVRWKPDRSSAQALKCIDCLLSYDRSFCHVINSERKASDVLLQPDSGSMVPIPFVAWHA